MDGLAVAERVSALDLGFTWRISPGSLRDAPAEVREAYRFAIANRETLRYIPCYCGCGSEGHTSNASCYVKDSSTPDKLIFDRMSLA